MTIQLIAFVSSHQNNNICTPTRHQIDTINNRRRQRQRRRKRGGGVSAVAVAMAAAARRWQRQHGDGGSVSAGWRQ